MNFILKYLPHWKRKSISYNQFFILLDVIDVVPADKWLNVLRESDETWVKEIERHQEKKA